MKLYGYVAPPFPIIDFVPIVYEGRKKKYLGYTRGGKISSFVEIVQSDYEIKKFNLSELDKMHADVDFQVNDNAVYGFLDSDDIVKIQTYEGLTPFLLQKLYSGEDNLYVKLSVAKFLNFTGKVRSIINKLNANSRVSEGEYELSIPDEDNFQTIHPNESKLLRSILNGVRATANAVPGKITIRDLLVIENDTLYAFNYKISLTHFLNRANSSTAVIKSYFQEHDSKEQRKIICKNYTLFYHSMNSPKPAQEQITEHSENRGFLKVYEIDRQLDFELESAQRPAGTKLDLLNQLKSMKEKFAKAEP